MNLETEDILAGPGCDAAAMPMPTRPVVSPPQDRHQLILENLAEVRYIANYIHSRLPPHVPIDDMIHAGVLGLIDAVEKFDAAKSLQFMSYARFRIKGAILDSLRGLDWGPRRLRKQARSIEQAQSLLLARLGRRPSESEVAAHLGLPVSELQHILAELQSLKLECLQESTGPGGVPSPPNCSSDDPFELCARLETSSRLTEAIGTLQERERQALTLYYFEERTMKEVGQILDVCESRVSQIISGALVALRSRLQNELNSANGK